MTSVCCNVIVKINSEMDSDTINVMTESRQYPDLSAAQDGYGYEPIHTSFCPDGVPLEFALLSLLAAFGVAFGVLYVALTMGKRSFRDIGEESEHQGDIIMFLGSQLADLLWSGIEH